MEDSNTTSVVTVKHMGNGYYKLTMRNSGKVVDVSNGGTANGTNVWQYDDNGTDAQRWVIKDAGDGYFYIISKHCGLYLDVADGIANDYQNVQVYTGNGTKAQKWKFIVWGAATGRTIADGEYYIASKCNTARSLSIDSDSSADGANVHLWDTTSSNRYERWKFVYQGNGYYKVTNVATGKVLDVYNAGTLSGTNVQQCKDNGTNAQRWIVKSVGNGYYSLVSKCNGHYLDLAWGNSSNGSNIQVYLGNGSNAQKWRLTKVSSASNLSIPKLSFASSSVTKSKGSKAFTNKLTENTDGKITYSSSNTKVATVNSSGKVTIKGVFVGHGEDYCYGGKDQKVRQGQRELYARCEPL